MTSKFNECARCAGTSLSFQNLEDEGVMPKSGSPCKSQQGDWVSYVKAKSLYFMQVCKLSPHVQRIGINREPQAQFEYSFIVIKIGGERFMRFRTSDWLIFV